MQLIVEVTFMLAVRLSANVLPVGRPDRPYHPAPVFEIQRFWCLDVHVIPRCGCQSRSIRWLRYGMLLCQATGAPKTPNGIWLRSSPNGKSYPDPVIHRQACASYDEFRGCGNPTQSNEEIGA
jgi:hypothetical protein